MSIKRVTSIILAAGIVALAVGAIPSSSAARSQSSDLSSASAAASHRLGAEMQLSPSPQCDSGHRGTSAVAYNPVHKEYLVAWTNEWPDGKMDIYARRVSESGQVLSWFCVASGLGSGGDGKSRAIPSVAYNAAEDQYLVVWMYEVSSNDYEIWGKRIPWDGPGSYPEFRIYDWPNRTFWMPRVAWNSARNEYLVIWNAADTSTWPAQATDVAGCRVSADGQVQPGAPIIITTTDQPYEADLIYSADQGGYMVVWTRVNATTSYDVYGAFLDPDGAKITPPGEFPISAGPGAQYSPAVASNEENRYMVVWTDTTAGNGDVYGRVFRANGSPFTDPFALANTTDNEFVSDVAANATGQYLTIWMRETSSGDNIVARLRDSDGTLTAPVNVFAPFWETDEAAVTCAVPGCLIAYLRGSPSTPYHIYGRLYWPQAVYLPLVLRAFP
ncbi:MAG: hypothetical protein JXA14_19680 [Anaerolineae bacterium]|nr:hypothetical protein [Anaerolineae bacterium]